MRIPATLIRATLFFALHAVVLPTVHGDTASDRIRAGPVYTAIPADGGAPEFPDVQVLVELPLPAAAGNVTPGAFRVRVNSRFYPATRVQTMAASGHPMAVAVVLDASGSMHGAPLTAVRSGLAQFAGDAGKRDRIAIETLADDTRWDATWGDSPEQVRTVIAKLASRGKMTHLWDGLLEALKQLPESPTARRVIVISDGHDEGSQHPLEEVIAASRQRLVPVDAIGITRSDPVYLANLERLSDETGGKFRATKTAADLERLVGGGIERLRSLPVVSFRLNDLRADGKVHELEVFWKHDGTEESSKAPLTAPKPRNDTYVPRQLLQWLAAIVFIGLVITTVARRRIRQPKAAVTPPAHGPQPVEMPIPTVVSAVNILRAAKPALSPGRVPLRDDRLAQSPAKPRQASPALSSARSRTQVSARFTVPDPSHPTAWLLGEAGFGAGRWFAVDVPEYWIGAGENNHLRITGDPTVSGNHACIVFETDVLGIFDHGSTNGTKVNGEGVRDYRRLLQPGDRIRVGRSTFVLQIQPRTEPAP